jgi:hypothetical protein
MAPGLSPVGMKDQQAGHTSSPPTILTVIRVGFLLPKTNNGLFGNIFHLLTKERKY